MSWGMGLVEASTPGQGSKCQAAVLCISAREEPLLQGINYTPYGVRFYTVLWNAESKWSRRGLELEWICKWKGTSGSDSEKRMVWEESNLKKEERLDVSSRGAIIVILRALMKHHRPAQIAYIEIIQFGLGSNTFAYPWNHHCNAFVLLCNLFSAVPPTPLQLYSITGYLLFLCRLVFIF